MKDRKILLLLIGLALTGLTVFLGCDTGGSDPKPPEQPQTDPVPTEFAGTWKNASDDPAHSDWQMEISDSKFTFSGTIEMAGGRVVAKGDLGKDRNSGKYTINATEVKIADIDIGAVDPLFGVEMKVDGNSLKITPPEGSTSPIAGFIGGTYTKQ